jgi:hypothetical protein
LRHAPRSPAIRPRRPSSFVAFALASVLIGATPLGSYGQRPSLEKPGCISGRVVHDVDRTPVEAAKVELQGSGPHDPAVVTDAHGAFEVAEGPRCLQSKRTSNIGVDYLRVSAAGCGTVLLDPCANGPWSDQIRLRPGANLTGRFEGAGSGHWINAVATGSDLSWPPQSGLATTDESWRAYTDAEGRFAFTDLPAQVLLGLSFDPELRPAIAQSDVRIVLKPGTNQSLESASIAASAGLTAIRVGGSNGPWVPVDPVAVGMDGRPRYQAWFESVDGGRLRQHKVGGGRWHVHGHRPCDHLEFTPGRYTLVGHDADGWFGVVGLEVKESDAYARPRVPMAPGCLLRLDGSKLDRTVLVTLSQATVSFAVLAIHPSEVRYEVVPAGDVHLSAAANGGELFTREITARAGSEVDLEL